MKTNNQKVVDAIVERCKFRKASPFTERFKVDSVEYAYMSEVDPHRDEPMGDERVWGITFLAVKPNYFFIYHFEGDLFCVEPELDKRYLFNFTELHALLKNENIQHFDNEDLWLSGECEPDTELACIFMIG